jgi:Na+/H+-dicarboxylate symporter
MYRLFAALKSLPVQLLVCVGCGFIFAPHLNIFVVQLFYSLSTSFIDILMTVLPGIIFIYIFCSIVALDRRSPIYIGLVLGSVTLSNMVALMTAYGVSLTLLPYISIPNVSDLLTTSQSSVTTLWDYRLPKFLGTDRAMLIGFVMGLIVSFLPTTSAIKQGVIRYSLQARDKVTHGLQKTFIPLLPLYITGFCLKLSYERSISFLFEYYAPVFILSLGVILVYLGGMYACAGGFKVKRVVQLIHNMAPAGLTAFTTMSSAATLPVTLKSTIKNTGHEAHTNLVVPTTANIHMVGDDLTIVITAMTLLTMNGQPFPDFQTFLLFAGAFCFAKLSCVGIPGASVLVILPVLEEFLGFNSTLISLVTTIYILQDPFGTCANVMSNGAFAVMVNKLFGWIKLTKPLPVKQNTDSTEVLAA